jgi:ATP-dependent helicase HepA
MQEFHLGQRWISAAELHLGLGMVIEVEHRTVSIIFPSSGETRIYARQEAPLSRVRFNAGDVIQNQNDDSFTILHIEESDGLIFYACTDESGQSVLLPEGKLNNFLQLNRPVERLMNGHIDRNKWFRLRNRARQLSNQLQKSSVFGLAGCRTSLIEHQLYIANEVSQRYAPRVLLADEVGLGKTIEAGLVIHQQLLQERVKRVLIVVPESLVHQWLVEMLRRFNLMFSVYNEARVLNANDDDDEDLLNSDNIFHDEQLVICSLSLLIDHPNLADQAIEGDWDMLVVDEAHHLTWSRDDVSPGYELVDQLASVTPGVLLLTATPEQLGKESHFARLRLLDPRRFNNLDAFLAQESSYQSLADLVEQLRAADVIDSDTLQKLEEILGADSVATVRVLLDDPDPEISQPAIQQLTDQLLDRHGTGRVLFRNTRHVVKGFPERELHPYPLEMPEGWAEVWQAHNVSNTQILQSCLSPELIDGISQGSRWIITDPRVAWLSGLLRDYRDRKVLVITSSADTALQLVERVKIDSGIQCAVFHENMSLIERDRAAAWFADQDGGSQVLICSEIGSEGRNFQFSHHLVLFDLPFNPDLLEQRIGRLDRIGQNAVIRIHAPYLKGSAQEVMFRWYHEGMNAFEQTSAAGHSLFALLHEPLKSALDNGLEGLDEFIQSTHQEYQRINQDLQNGRDRLLEMNSCRIDLAEALTDEAIQRDYDMDLFSFMERIYDCFGINSDLRGQDCWVISPSDNMLSPLPGLYEDGMTVTYNRSIALANEDVHYLSWEHPLVRNAMEMILSTEFGNTALVAIKQNFVKPGTVLLESHFMMEFADEAGLDSRRYFPDAQLCTIIDEQGRFIQVDEEYIKQNLQRVDQDTSMKIVRAREIELTGMLEQSENAAKLKTGILIEAARDRAESVLGLEIDRLVSLQAINPSVRDEEIDFFRQQKIKFENALGQARLRLDAVRVIIAI